MRIPLIAAGLLALASPAASEETCAAPTHVVSVPSKTLLGRDLVAMSDAELSAYLVGFREGVLMSGFLPVPEKCFEKVFACLKDLQTVDAARTIRRYLSENADSLAYPTVVIGFEALVDPCAG